MLKKLVCLPKILFLFFIILFGIPTTSNAEIIVPTGFNVKTFDVPAGVTLPLGDVVFSADGNTLYILGGSETAASGVWSVPVTRDPVTGRVSSLGAATPFFPFSPNPGSMDTSLEFHNGTLFFRTNDVDPVTFLPVEGGGDVGERTSDGTITLFQADGAASWGGLAFVPLGLPNEGDLLVGNWQGPINSHSLTDNLDGTFTLTPGSQTLYTEIDTSGGFTAIGDLHFIPSAWPFANDLMFTNWNGSDSLGGTIEIVDIDPSTGLPVGGGFPPIITQFASSFGFGPWGLEFDPITNDLFVSILDFSFDPTGIIIQISLNTPPVADAGPDQDIYLGETAQLDGSNSSDSDGTIVSYTWAIDAAPEFSVATLSDPNIVNPTLTSDLAGQYIISLVVNDGTDDGAADTVIVNVTLNLSPVAVATGVPTAGDAPHTVNFDASGSSDPELGSLAFDWDFGDPASGASNTSTLVNPTHIYNDVGNYTAVVIVTDDFNNIDQASVEIEVTALNMPPTVSPTATVNDFTVQFMANANDPEGDSLTYTWDSGDSTALSSDVNPTHIYNNPGTYTATVTVSDGEFDVSGDVVVSVFSSLGVDVYEAKVDSGKKGKLKGKVNLKACFSFIGLPLPSDVIKVDFDGITLIEEPFGSFEEKVDKPGKFKYKVKDLHAKIDFNKSKIEVSRHKMLLNGFDNSNGVDVVISFGLLTGSDHILMKERHGRKKCSFKEKHHHHNCDD